jgi:hypothetical protein
MPGFLRFLQILFVLVDQALNAFVVLVSQRGVNHLPAFEEDQSGVTLQSVAIGDVHLSFSINLQHGHLIGHIVGNLLDKRVHAFAWATPSGVEINHGQFGRGDGLVEFGDSDGLTFRRR